MDVVDAGVGVGQEPGDLLLCGPGLLEHRGELPGQDVDLRLVAVLELAGISAAVPEQDRVGREAVAAGAPGYVSHRRPPLAPRGPACPAAPRAPRPPSPPLLPRPS